MRWKRSISVFARGGVFALGSFEGGGNLDGGFGGFCAFARAAIEWIDIGPDGRISSALSSSSSRAS
jgi:hypothetical protein